MNYFYNKRDKSVLLQQGIFQIVLYFTKDWLGLISTEHIQDGISD